MGQLRPRLFVRLMEAVSVMCETAARSNSGKSTREVQLAIDEYAQVANAKANVDAGLTMSRKHHLHFYLLFQDFEQLKTSGGDLGPVVRSQCQRIVFSATSREETNELRDRSLDVTRDDVGSSLHGMGVSTSVREVEEPGLTRNSILRLSAEAMKAYAVLNLGDRHRDPIPFTIIPPTKSIAEHRELKNKPLPTKPLCDEPQSPEPRQIERSVNQTLDEAARGRREQLLALISRITQETTWQLGGKQS